MERAPRWRFLAISVGCGAIGIAAWVFYISIAMGAPGKDWMVYYAAARAYLEGNLAVVLDGDAFTAVMNERFAHFLSSPLPSPYPWVYPPHFLLLLLPFGLLPFAIAGVLFLLLTFAGLTLASWRFAGTNEQRTLFAFSLLLCPAAAVDVSLGQNAFLTSALLVGGFGLLERRPLLAGALLGMLTYKPQFFLMAPVALIAAREWRALAGAVAMVIVMVLASAAVFGLEIWRSWIALMLGSSDLYKSWLIQGRLHGLSIYACAALLGASPAMASAMQATVTGLAGCVVYWSFRRPAPRDLRAATLLAATVIAAPHIVLYDTLMLAVAATLLLARALTDGFRSGDTILIMAVWLCTVINPPILDPAGLVTPLLVVLFIACVIARIRAGARPAIDGRALAR